MAKPIPEGFHTVTPHLTVKGAAKAIELYKNAFGAEEVARMPGPGGMIMHAELRIGDSPLMLNDEMPGDARSPKAPATLGGTHTVVHLYVEDADALFQRAVDAGCTPLMPISDQFWGDRYGMVEDPFGHRWSIATHTRDLTPEEITRAGQEFMARMQQGGGPC